jgi:SAM-dependent methyltransferase
LKNPVKETLRKLAGLVGYRISRIHVPLSPSERPPDFAALRAQYAEVFRERGIDKAHYGCGPVRYGEGWVNIDRCGGDVPPPQVLVGVDLSGEQPFASNSFKFSFSEDFLEHLDQAGAIAFLYEAHRTLRPAGVLRLSFPGLRGVLREYYLSNDFQGVCAGRQGAYVQHVHKHFFCEESLAIVASHIGFSKIEFVEYGKSAHSDLRNLDFRELQKHINIYAELTK